MVKTSNTANNHKMSNEHFKEFQRGMKELKENRILNRAETFREYIFGRFIPYKRDDEC